MNALLALAATAGAALLAAVALSASPANRPAAPAGAGGAAEQVAEMVAPARRNVTPAGITPGPQVDGPMERVALPEPPPPPPEPIRWRRFFQVVASAAGRLDLDGRAVRIAGITPAEAGRICGIGDAAWPCGRAALTAFRMLLRGRAVECRLDTGAEAGPCRIGSTDLAEWLLAQGWAEPAADAAPELQAAAATAGCAGRGLWRDAPRQTGCPR